MAFLPVTRLTRGDTVSIVAPAGPFEREVFERGRAVLASRYTPVVGEHLYDKHRYLAGPDEARASDLQRALSSTRENAVFAARGGYGVMRLLTRLDLRHTRTAVVGFSDLTALHLATQAAGVRSLHAPVVTQLGTQPPEVAERLFSLLEGRDVAPLLGTETFVDGVAEGPLLGGNLSVLTRLLGTPYLPSLAGAVLLLEDVGERPYRLDRMWAHLTLSGALAQVAGIVLGEFSGCEEKDADYTSADVLRELARQTNVPCAAGFAIGHGKVNQPVPLGARVRLDASSKSLTLLEGLVT